MTLDFSEIIFKIKEIEKAFNTSDDPVKRYALIQTLNYIAENELPVHDWLEKQLYDAMIRTLSTYKR